MKKLLFLIIILSLGISCADRNAVPKDVLPRDKMQAVMWSMISAGEYLNAYALKDSVDKVEVTSKAYGDVFQIHHITKQQFDKSFAYYRDHPDLMKTILDSLSKKQTYDIERFQRGRDTIHRKMIKAIDSLR